MLNSRSVILIVACACFSSSAFGQSRLTDNTLKLDENSSPADADIEDFNWLQGYWVGEGFGGVCEEAWMPALGDSKADAASMTCSFRLLVGGKLQFSEFFLLFKHEGRWTLRLKHFSANMHGWEAQDKFTEFPLVRISEKKAWFSGLTYQITESGNLEAIVAMKQKDGTYREETIKFQRKTV